MQCYRYILVEVEKAGDPYEPVISPPKENRIGCGVASFDDLAEVHANLDAT